jgi:hypothetical protein
VTALRQWTGASGGGAGQSFNPGKDYLFAPQTATRFEWNKWPDTPLPPDEPAGQNPPDGAIIHYFLERPASGDVNIEILDAAGALVRKYSSSDPRPEIQDTSNVPWYWIRPAAIPSAGAGLHRFVWDLHYPPVPGAELQYPISATPGNTAPEPKGPWVVPGTYRVKLTVNGQSYAQSLTVRMDPRVKTTPADLQRQFTLAKRVYDALADLQKKIALQPAGASDAAAAGGPPTARSVYQDVLAVYPLTQEGSGPIAAGSLDAVNRVLEAYRTFTGGPGGRQLNAARRKR